jgi:putative DNA primase/helicase
VRFVLSSNELPRLADASGALASRFIVLVMRESFLGREDLGLEQRIRSELSGILNWCLEGRQRLLARGYFVQPAASADTLRELEDLSSPVKAFLRDRCSIAPALTITPEALYTAWRGWCESTGRDKPGTLQSFGKDLRAALAWLQTSMPRGPDGKQRRVYEGIGLATPDTRTRTDTRKSPLPAVTPFSPSVPSSSPDSPDSIYARNAEMRVSPSVRPCPACGGEGCEWCQEASP